MKLLLDQGLAHQTASLLKADGIDALHVSDIGLSSASDKEIITQAKILKRIIVTFDTDFHALMALSGETFPSVIRIRIENLKRNEQYLMIKDIIKGSQKNLEKGVLMTVQKNKIRVRYLPIK